MNKRCLLPLVATFGCGGITTGGDASVDASTTDALIEASDAAVQCIPYVVASDGGNGFCEDGPCPDEIANSSEEGAYSICTRSCSDLQACALGFVCDLPGPAAKEFVCFVECDDGGTCAAPLHCGGYTTKNACH